MEGVSSKIYGRDMIDSMLTYVNKDLLICKLFYFFFFAAFGSLYPLLAIYFKQLGMNATQSGILIGFRPFIEFCSAPFWGGVADKTRKWRQLQLFSLFCWIVFTLAMAFVKPGHEKCFGDGNVTGIIDDGNPDLIRPAYSTVYYSREDVKDAFFSLLLIVVIGEFFSAPAITFADAVTLSYLGTDTDNYGRQRMFGSLGWGLSMFFVGMALDHSKTFPDHPCKNQHQKEKDYIVCFAVFSVLMSCAWITATQFKFPGQDDTKGTWPEVLLVMKDKVTEKITGKKRTDRDTLVEEDDEFKFGQPRDVVSAPSGADTGSAKLNENGKPLQISLESKKDMVSDVVNSPGAAPMLPPDPDEPFLGRWMAVLKLLAQLKFVSVLFVVWFMGFGIGLIFTFLFWHLQDLGGSPTLFGVASVINHMAELLAYFLCSSFIAQFGHINVLYAGVMGNIARFIYISVLKNPWWVLPFECVQGLTHAAVWATTCSYIMQAIPVGLRSSAQGILQGLHHGLGRGCGAVFGGIMVNSYGSENTFRAYGIACIFVLAAFFGTNYYLKKRGIPIESHVPHSTLEEEGIGRFDPHGVPSALTRDLSSSKLKQNDTDQMTGYGSTLGTDINQRNKDTQNTYNQPDDDFNPRAEEYDNTFNPRDEEAAYRNDPYGRKRHESNQYQSHDHGQGHIRGKRAEPEDSNQSTEDFYNRKGPKPNRDTSGYDQTDFNNDYSKLDDSQERRDIGRRRASDESPRRRSADQNDGRERKERRRRQSGDPEGLREREEAESRDSHRRHGGEGRRHGEEGRRHGDRDDYRQRGDDSRGQRRHSKSKRSMDGAQFEDPDPNPREKIVFEQLPDFSNRGRRQDDTSRDGDGHSRPY